MTTKPRDSRAHKINWAIDKLGFAVLGYIGTMIVSKLDNIDGALHSMSMSMSRLQMWAHTVGEQLGVTFTQ